MSAKGIIKGIVTAAVICGLGAGGWVLYKNYSGTKTDSTEKVYVQKVATINTVDGANLFTNNFAGVIVAQKTVDVKYDMSKQVDEILVHEGDAVKKGDKLLTYNVEQIQLDIESAELEVERLQNQIKTNEMEISTLEQERRTASGDAQVSYTTKILALQSDNARSEYDIKTKNVEITKLKNSLENAYVTAPIDGTVKDLKEPSAPSDNTMNYSYGDEDAADVIMKIAAEGDFRVKGVFNEQNVGNIREGAKVFLRSRIDDNMRRGEITEIDTKPQKDDSSMYYGYSDEQTQSSKYAFYVTPESLEGFMLGQHVLIEMDNGQNDAEKKEGIWLYNAFVLWDGDQNYVWAKNSRDQIEKRIVTVGNVDDENNDCQILSGLEIDDYIAYPADYIEAGMKTTTNQSDKDIPENVGSNMMDDEMPGMDDYTGDEAMQMDENVSYDEEGNMIYVDEEGNVFKFDPEGNMIEGSNELFGDEAMPEGIEGEEPVIDEQLPADAAEPLPEEEQPAEN